MIRWRVLTREERTDPTGPAGAVDVRVSARYVVPCILEQWDDFRGGWFPIVPEYHTEL